MAYGEEKAYWIWLQSVIGCGSHRSNELASRFSGPREIYELGRQGLEASRAFTAGEIKKIEATPLEGALRILRRCEELSITVLTPDDPAYPERLRHIYAMPLVLYLRGELGDIDHLLAIGMVGTRECTDYGVRVGKGLSAQLTRCGVVVVSGLARGIDTHCVRAALEQGGKAVAVLGSGLDVPYPPENTALIEQMSRLQTVISEYPPGTKPLPKNFPIRNRLISGLSLGVVVVEGGPGSGALITAGHALEQGRDVFAVPGRIDDYHSLGPLGLIRQGAAKAVLCASDILSEYEYLYPAPVQKALSLERERQKGKVAGGRRSGKDPALSSGSRPSRAPRGTEPPGPVQQDDTPIPIFRILPPETAAGEGDAGMAGGDSPRQREEKARGGDRHANGGALVSSEPQPAPKMPEGMSEREQKVYRCLTEAPVRVQELSAACGMGMGELLPLLTSLEIRGLIETASMGRIKLRTKFSGRRAIRP